MQTVYALEVNLISPENNHIFHSPKGIFYCNASDENGLTNISFYINGTLNQTKSVSGNHNETYFEIYGKDIWINWTCQACNINGECKFANESRLAFINSPSYCGGSINCSCGDTLNESWVMPYDMECNGTALYIGANSITLDCNGHHIKGNGTGSGIEWSSRYDYVTIKNCEIYNFSNGINENELGAYSAKILNNNIHDITWYGIRISKAYYVDYAEIKFNNISNSHNGLFFNGRYSKIENNIFKNNNIGIAHYFNSNVHRNNTYIGNTKAIYSASCVAFGHEFFNEKIINNVHAFFDVLGCDCYNNPWYSHNFFDILLIGDNNKFYTSSDGCYVI